MNFKSVTLFIGLVLCSTSSYSQNYGTGQGEINTKDVEKLKTGMLYVITDENPSSDFAKAMESAFTSYWKFSKFTLIKPSQLSGKLMEKDAYFFSFSCMLTGGSGGAHGSAFYDLFIDPNSIASERKKDVKFRMNGADEMTFMYTFNYGIFMPYKKTKYDDQDWLSPYPVIQTVQMLDFITLGFTSQMMLNMNVPAAYKTNNETALSFKEPLSMAQNKTLSEIPFYVLRLENHLDYVVNHHGEPKTKTIKNKIAYSAKGKTDDENAKITTYDDGIDRLKGKKLLLDSNLCDKTSIKILAKALGMQESKIQLVGWGDILKAIATQDASVAMIFLHDVSRTSNQTDMVWAADGTPFVSVEFSVAHDIFSAANRWGFQIPFGTTYGVPRSDIQILN